MLRPVCSAVLFRLAPVLALVILAPPLRAQEAESCEFRVIAWNTDGFKPGEPGSSNDLYSDPNLSFAQASALIGEFVLAEVERIDANAVALQEVTSDTVQHIESSLPGWECHSQLFGTDDNALCVAGAASNVVIDYLGSPDLGDPPPEGAWWGYVQAEFKGVRITSLHTRSAWRQQHVDQLHLPVVVPSGILAGDFNYVDPTVSSDPSQPAWHQTLAGYDPALEPNPDWTLEADFDDSDEDQERVKVDHVVSVEAFAEASGETRGFGGSNHKLVTGTVRYPPEAPGVSVAIANPELPIAVDGSCSARVDFLVSITDDCCLDPDDLGLEVVASNPTANATLGPVVIDSVVAGGERDVLVTAHVDVSALQSCPAEVAIHASAHDCAGNAGDSDSQGSSAVAIAVDSSAPEVTASEADLQCLWPPNHDYVCFDTTQVTPEVSDNCTSSPAWSFAQCASDQPDDGAGDGNTTNDCVLEADAAGFCARSERAGMIAVGRRYAVQIAAQDACGNLSLSTQVGNVHVPRSAEPTQTCVAPDPP